MKEENKKMKSNDVNHNSFPNIGEISLLSNCYIYSFSLVFIMCVPEGYRLILMQNENEEKSGVNKKRFSPERIYQTVKGARIAFLKEWWYRAILDNVKPEWTHFYPVDANWLSEKLKRNL